MDFFSKFNRKLKHNLGLNSSSVAVKRVCWKGQELEREMAN